MADFNWSNTGSSILGLAGAFVNAYKGGPKADTGEDLKKKAAMVGGIEYHPTDMSGLMRQFENTPQLRDVSSRDLYNPSSEELFGHFMSSGMSAYNAASGLTSGMAGMFNKGNAPTASGTMPALANAVANDSVAAQNGWQEVQGIQVNPNQYSFACGGHKFAAGGATMDWGKGLGTGINLLAAFGAIGAAAAGQANQEKLAEGYAAEADANNAYARQLNTHNFNNAVFDTKNNMHNMQALQMMAMGGDLQTLGADFPLNGDFNVIGAGGTHEQNPNGGVFQGVAVDGKPNLVEENEVVWNDYVFSNRINIPKEFAKTYKLREKISYADAAQKLIEEAKERPNDPISQNGIADSLSALQKSQEETKQKREAARMKRMINKLSPGELMQLVSAAQGAQAPSEAQLPQMPEGMGAVPPQGMGLPQEMPAEGSQIGVGSEEMPFAYGGHVFKDGGYSAAKKAYEKARKEWLKYAQKIIPGFDEGENHEVHFPAALEHFDQQTIEDLVGKVYNNEADTKLQAAFKKLSDEESNAEKTLSGLLEIYYPRVKVDKNGQFKFPSSMSESEKADVIERLNANELLKSLYEKQYGNEAKLRNYITKNYPTALFTDGTFSFTTGDNSDKTIQSMMKDKELQNLLSAYKDNATLPGYPINIPTAKGSSSSTQKQEPLREASPSSTIGTSRQRRVASSTNSTLSSETDAKRTRAMLAKMSPMQLAELAQAYNGYDPAVYNMTNSAPIIDFIMANQAAGNSYNDIQSRIAAAKNFRILGDDELPEYNITRTPNEGWDDYFDTLFNYRESLKRGNSEGKYNLDKLFNYRGMDTTQIEKDPDYMEFENYVLEHPDDPKVQQYLKILDEQINTEQGTEKLFNDNGMLRDNWKDLYKYRRHDQAGGIYHFFKDMQDKGMGKRTIYRMNGQPIEVSDPNALSKFVRQVGRPTYETTVADNGDALTTEYIDLEGLDFDAPEPAEEEKPQQGLPTWMRYAPAIGAFAGMFQGPAKDYSTAVSPIFANYTPIGDYLAYNPVDTQRYINAENKQAAAQLNAVMNAGVNRNAALAQAAYANQQRQQNLGKILEAAEQVNFGRKAQVGEFNRGTNQFNAGAYNHAALANMQVPQFLLHQDQNNQRMRYQADAARDAAVSASTNAFLDSLANIGNENVAWNQINSNQALRFGANSNPLVGQGTSFYKTAALGGNLLTKKNRR